MLIVLSQTVHESLLFKITNVLDWLACTQDVVGVQLVKNKDKNNTKNIIKNTNFMVSPHILFCRL